MAKCETREEAKDKIKDAGVILNDQELDAVAGGAYRYKALVHPDSEGRRRKF